MQRSKLTFALASLATTWFTGSALHAQTYQAWVDPTFGNNANGVVQVAGAPSGPQAPFQTINAAIASVSAAAGVGGSPPLSAANPGLVHCMPGLYSAVSNGEVLPITMVDFISLQGVAGARGTVIVGFQTSPYVGPSTLPGVNGVFLPLIPVGVRSLTQEVVFSGIGLRDDLPETIDGFTVRGGNIQFYIEAFAGEFGQKSWTISNCVLDMLNVAPEITPLPLPVFGPTFGVLQVAAPLVDSCECEPTVIQANVQTNFIHNTVVMSWQNVDDNVGAPSAMVDSVGFCDVNDPLGIYAPPLTPDPNQTLRGVSSPLISNNIFRTTAQLCPQPPFWSALLGVDSTDTSIAVGTVVGPTNAFDSTLAASASIGVSPATMFASAILGAIPIPLIDSNPLNANSTCNMASSGIARDAAFVGEFLNRTPATAVDPLVRDWRLLPDSVYIDVASAPAPLPIGGQGLIATNGAVFRQPAPGSTLIDSFDWDGEGPGNARIVPNPSVVLVPAAPDLGFDEANALIFTQSYANESICHDVVATNFGYPSTVGNGQSQRSVIVPGPGSLSFHANTSTVPIGTLPFPSFSQMPNVLNPGIPVSGQPLANAHLFPFPPPLLTAPIPIVSGYLAPFDAALGLPGHTFGQLTTPDSNTSGVAFYITWQAVWNSAIGPLITNAQNEIY